MISRFLTRFIPGHRSSMTPIGLEFDDERVSWVQLEGSKDRWRVRDAVSFKHSGDVSAFLSSGNEFRDRAKRVLRDSCLSGCQVVTHAPAEHLRLMVLNYSNTDGESESGQIMDLARERMQDDLSSHVVDYLPIRTSGERQGDRSAIVAVVPEAPVLERLEALDRAGLDVIALEIAPVAIRRLVVGKILHRTPPPPGELALVLRIGQTGTELTLLSGRRLLLYRQIEVGFDRIVAAVSKNLDCEVDAAVDLLSSYGVGVHSTEISDDVAFAKEAASFEGDDGIANSLREIIRPELKTLVEQAHKAVSYAAFQTHGMGIDLVHLIAGARPCPGFDGLLSEMLQLPVENYDPMRWIEASTRNPGLNVDYRHMNALGYALRGCVDE